MSSQSIPDVAVIGAGPAGSTAALRLAREGLDVLLLDRQRFPRAKTCGDALTPRALEALHEMGLLECVRAAGHRVDHVEVVAPDGGSVVTAMSGRPGISDYGLTLTRRRFDERLRRAATTAGATFLGGVDVRSLQPDTTGVTLQGARPCRARAVVVASGAMRTALRRSGLESSGATPLLAARGYFTAAQIPRDRIQFRFDGVPLPAYGWIFPMTEDRSNVGTMVYERRCGTAQRAYKRFVGSSDVAAQLKPGCQVGATDGYPLRCDFASATTIAERTLIVGEAAGLVNPLTGEGIDYALESGWNAGEQLAEMLRCDDFSPQRLESWDRSLRQRYGRLFRACERIRKVALRPALLNRLVALAARRPDLTGLLVDIVHGRRELDPAELPRGLMRAVLAR